MCRNLKKKCRDEKLQKEARKNIFNLRSAFCLPQETLCLPFPALDMISYICVVAG